MQSNGYLPRTGIYRNLTVQAGYLTLEGDAVIQSDTRMVLLNADDVGIEVGTGATGTATFPASLAC